VDFWRELFTQRAGRRTLWKQYLMDRYFYSSVCLFPCHLERQGWIDAIREGGGKDFDETMKEERGGVVVSSSVVSLE
jgi:hypothetical protein